jgi:2-polyprenyl-6-methoxyphenol hydroxylase-like FAD-dependent oxidoreductase
MRSTLHKVLLDACAEMGELIDIKWGVKLSRIEEEEQGVTAHFEDGSTAKGSVVS